VVGERRDLVPSEILEGQVLARLRGDGRALVRLVEDHRAQVEGQVVRALAVDRGCLGGHGLGGGRRRWRVGGPVRGSGSRPFGPLDGKLLEQRVFLELLPDDLLELERGELQELDGLLEQRRHDDALCLP
jgi:hypothetical protein